MYEVNINAPPEHFLDWDKPLSEQHPVVQEALIKAGLFKGQNPTVADLADVKMTGGDAYKTLQSEARGGPVLLGSNAGSPHAADALRDAGLPGIRYLDAGSRGAAEGTRNTVIFDPATIEILRKYGIAGLMAGGAGAAATQQPQQ
jgi:hypothetical protein